MESTNEAARTLRGTAAFLSTNVVDPVIRVHSSVAAVQRAIQDLLPVRHS